MRLSSKAIQSEFPICKPFWSLQMPVCQGLPLRLEGRRLAGGQAAPAHGTASHVEPPPSLTSTRMPLSWHQCLDLGPLGAGGTSSRRSLDRLAER